MKSLKPTLIMILLLGVVGGYTYFEHHSQENERVSKEADSKIFQVKPDQITKIELTGKNGALELSLEDSKWRLTSPINDEADQEAVLGWVEELLNESAKPVSEGKEIQWSDYGLTQPPYQVRLHRQGGEPLEISTSDRVAFDGSYFLKKGDQVVLGGTRWGQLLSKKSDSFRKRDFLSDLPLALSKVSYASKALNFVLNKDEELGWKSETSSLKGKRLDPIFIDQWVSDLRMVKASGFLDGENSIKKKAPTLQLSFASKELQSPVELQFFEHEKKIYTKKSGKEVFYEIPETSMKKVILALADLRDGRLPFRFELEGVSQIQLKSPQKSALVQKAENSWKLKDQSSKKLLNEKKLLSLIQKLRGLEAFDFRVRKPKKPTHSIEFKDASGKLIKKFSWGTESFQPKVGKSEKKELIWLQASGGAEKDSNESYGVLKSDLESLDFDSLITEPKEVEETTSTSDQEK